MTRWYGRHWEPTIASDGPGFPSDGKKTSEGLQGARDRWVARTNQAVFMRDEAVVTQVHVLTPPGREAPNANAVNLPLLLS